MSERLYQATSRRATVGFVVADRDDRPVDAPGEVVECAPYVRKLIMGLGEALAVSVLERRGFDVQLVSRR